MRQISYGRIVLRFHTQHDQKVTLFAPRIFYRFGGRGKKINACVVLNSGTPTLKRGSVFFWPHGVAIKIAASVQTSTDAAHFLAHPPCL